jgi:hypothetical protein
MGSFTAGNTNKRDMPGQGRGKSGIRGRATRTPNSYGDILAFETLRTDVRSCRYRMAGAQQKRAVAWIRIQGQRSRWRLPNGIALGDDLQGVKRRNGGPFRLAGFSVEGQGAVRSWGGGRIRSVDAGPCSVKISFQPCVTSLKIYQ